MSEPNSLYVKVLTILLCCFVGQTGFSQQAKLVYKGIEENRLVDYRNNELAIITELQGTLIDPDHKIRIKEITKAVDNIGNQLVVKNGYPYPTNYYTREKELVIGLSAPSRQATAISVEGSLEYFVISEAKNSKIEQTNIRAMLEKNILAGKVDNAQLVLLNAEKWARMKNENPKSIGAEAQSLHKQLGIGENEKKAEFYVYNIIRDFEYKNNKNGPGTALYFYKKDDENTIVSVDLFNAEGKKMTKSYYNDRNTYYLSSKEEIIPDFMLRIVVKNANALQEIPFKIEHIKLP